MTSRIHRSRLRRCIEAPSLAVSFGLGLLCLCAFTAKAQLAPAENFFNSGAQLYISNNIPAALEQVESGLKTYPDDVKLKKLEQLLKQQQQSQQQQQQQQNQQNQQNQSQQQQKQDQQKNQQQNQSSQQQSQEQQKQDEQKQSAQKQDEQQKQKEQEQQQAQKQQDEKDKQQEGEPVKAGQMTPEEAKRLLDAQKENEQMLQLKPQGKPRPPHATVKDW